MQSARSYTKKEIYSKEKLLHEFSYNHDKQKN